MFKDDKEKALKKLRKEIRSGVYSVIILSILRDNSPIHGYAIRKTFKELSNGKLVPSEGTLYDLLRSLEKYKLIEGFWGERGGRVRRYYRITPLGREVLAEIESEIKLIFKVLREVF